MERRQGVQHKEHKNQTVPNLAKGMKAAAGERKEHENTHSSRQNRGPKQVKTIPLHHRDRVPRPAATLAFPL